MSQREPKRLRKAPGPWWLKVATCVAPRAGLGALDSIRSRFPTAIHSTADGLRWRIRDTGGEGQAIVFVPRALGSADIFFDQLLCFSLRYRCIALDYPAASPERLADGFAELLDRLALSVPSLVGTSLGGYWLQYLGARHPSRLSTLLLTNTFIDSQDLGREPPFRSSDVRLKPSSKLKQQWIEQIRRRPESALRDVQLELLSEQDSQLFKARLIAVGSAPRSPLIRLSHDRTAILDCADDPLLPASTREALASRYSMSWRRTLPVGGHYPYATSNEAYNAFIEQSIRAI